MGDKVILLCNSISCWIKGCDSLQQKISEQLGVGLGETTPDNRYTLLPVTCLGACDKAPVLMVGDDLHEDVDDAALQHMFAKRGWRMSLDLPLTRNVTPDRAPTDFSAYEANGGYQGLRAAVGKLSPAECLQIIKDSNLRGRGGAGFPTGMKWSFVPMDNPRWRSQIPDLQCR